MGGREGGRERGRERLGRERGRERERPDLNEGHVHTVHVGPLLPVHLDADKAGVEQCPNLLTLKGLPLHDVAPVQGGVADREEDQLVLSTQVVITYTPNTNTLLSQLSSAALKSTQHITQ